MEQKTDKKNIKEIIKQWNENSERIKYINQRTIRVGKRGKAKHVEITVYGINVGDDVLVYSIINGEKVETQLVRNVNIEDVTNENGKIIGRVFKKVSVI